MPTWQYRQMFGWWPTIKMPSMKRSQCTRNFSGSFWTEHDTEERKEEWKIRFQGLFFLKNFASILLCNSHAFINFSNQPQEEVVTILSTFGFMDQCEIFVYGHGGFSNMLSWYLNDDAQAVNIDAGNEGINSPDDVFEFNVRSVMNTRNVGTKQISTSLKWV